MVMNKNDYLRNIPSVDEIINRPEVSDLARRFSRSIIVKAVQRLLSERREKILSAPSLDQLENEVSLDEVVSQIETKINEISQLSLRRVINASGIIVHTNLGRAPLSEEAVEAIIGVARYYNNLEFDLESGRRGSRNDHTGSLLRELTGAENSLAVNNNAAAVLLCLNALAKGKEVIISRGELVEIGGSFRIPDIMHQSGATLVEVGTTNRTHPSDYRKAINEQTALILKVHTSNYRVVGFSSEVELSELVEIGGQYNIPVMFDMGSGNFIESSLSGLRDEPTVQDSLKSGVDVVTFSGDKLLGGPQAGIIAGKNICLKEIRKNPLLRALRIDKLTVAALEATLKNYILNPDSAGDIPVIGMLTVSDDMLRKRALKIKRKINKLVPALDVSVAQDASRVGGGAYPLHDLPTWVVSVNPSPLSVNEFECLLRKCTPPVISRISRERVLLDVRTLFQEEDSLVAGCVSNVLSEAMNLVRNRSSMEQQV